MATAAAANYSGVCSAGGSSGACSVGGYAGGAGGSAAGGGAGTLLLLVPISIPTASERVTVRFEIGIVLGSVEEVAVGVEPISILAASERVTTWFEIGTGFGLWLLIRVMMLWIRGINTLWSLFLL